MKITENYMEKVYAGWLGKIIGIRLGAPIEGWTYQRIRDVFGDVWCYPADYKLSLIHISEPTRPTEIWFAVFCG